MANPNFPSDGQSERIDALVGTDGTVYLKAALGDINVTGADNDSAAHLIGTHLDAATAGSTDPVAVVAGLSGTTVKHLVVDSGGRLVVVGAAADGASPVGSPVLNGGYDGTNVQYLTVDTNGYLVPVGIDAVGASPTVNPLSVAWTDGTNLRRPRTDTSGYPTIVPGGYTDGSLTYFARRIPNVFKMVAASASGDSNVWTPTSGKKFRLLAYSFSVTPNIITSGGGVITAKLRDNTTDMNMQWQFYAPTTAVTTVAGLLTTPWVVLGDGGYLSVSANNVLHVNLSAATTGSVMVNAIGTEE